MVLFAVLPQTGKDLSLQASFSLNWLPECFLWIVLPYCFECVFGVAFVHRLLIWCLLDPF